MEFSRRLMGFSAIASPAHTIIDVDTEGLIRRILLFDRYILVSARLQEFPHLVRHLGFHGLHDLLTANVMDVRHECFQVVSVGQSGLFGAPVLPPYTDKFNWIDTHDWSKYVEERRLNRWKLARA